MLENVRSYGLIIKNRKILVCNENINNFSATKFPGGGVEKNESPEDALIREIKEELSLNIKVGNMIATIDLNKTVKNIYVHYYYAIILSGQISLNVHSEFKWVPHPQLKNFTYIDGDRHILNYL